MEEETFTLSPTSFEHLSDNTPIIDHHGDVEFIPNSVNNRENEKANDHGCHNEIDHEQQTRVILWCTPRSTSTILTKCLGFVPESQIFFEPYNSCYEARSWLKSLGRDVDPRSMSSYGTITTDEWLKVTEMKTGEDCRDRVNFDLLKFPYIKYLVENPDRRKKVVFIKEMAYALDDLYDMLPDKSYNYKHAFLIRHPVKVFNSWKRVTSYFKDLPLLQSETPSKFSVVKDMPTTLMPPGLFYREIYDMWLHIKQHYDPNPVVMESDDLLSDPDAMLPKFCRSLGIPYSDKLLNWSENYEDTSGWVSAFPPADFEVQRIFCRTALTSTRFCSPTSIPTDEHLADDVKKCASLSMPYYMEMYNNRI